MLNYYPLQGNKRFYYDVERQTIARLPTKSNLLSSGSDNSLFFGLTKDANLCVLFTEFFKVKEIDDIKGLLFEMSAQGSKEKVRVEVNINKEGQIQVKIGKNGTMHMLTTNYALVKMQNIDFLKTLIVVDFQNLEIRFKDLKELDL